MDQQLLKLIQFPYLKLMTMISLSRFVTLHSLKPLKVKNDLFCNKVCVYKHKYFVGQWLNLVGLIPLGNALMGNLWLSHVDLNSESFSFIFFENQDISSTSTSGGGDVTTNVHWTGALSGNLATFEGGFQMTLLPGGMYMGYPSDIAKSVAESKSFHLEFCWLESPGKRQRLVRTYDMEGLAVSSTHFSETRV